jgi:hypothetical protein
MGSDSEKPTMYEHGSGLYLKVTDEGAQVVHQEHAAQTLEAGTRWKMDSSARPFFHLDPDERLPRENVLDRGRGGLQLNTEGWRKLTRAEVAAAIASPLLIPLGVVLGETGAPLPVVVIAITLVISSLVAFAWSGRRRPQHLRETR